MPHDCSARNGSSPIVFLHKNLVILRSKTSEVFHNLLRESTQSSFSRAVAVRAPQNLTLPDQGIMTGNSPFESKERQNMGKTGRSDTHGVYAFSCFSPCPPVFRTGSDLGVKRIMTLTNDPVMNSNGIRLQRLPSKRNSPALKEFFLT
jgi:hypothetical protein